MGPETAETPSCGAERLWGSTCDLIAEAVTRPDRPPSSGLLGRLAVAEVLEKGPPPLFQAFLAVEPLRQPEDAFAQLLRRHAARLVVHIEQRAEIPAFTVQDPS